MVNNPIIPIIDSRSLDILECLTQVSESVSQIRVGDSSCLADILIKVAAVAGKITQSPCSVIAPYDPEKGSFAQVAIIGSGAAGLIPWELFPEAMAMQAIQEQSIIISHEGVEEPQTQDSQLVACYPLVTAGTPVGVLIVLNHERICFTTEEKLALSILANLATTAIQQAGSLSGIQKDLNRKEEELHHLRRAGMLISTRLQLEETLEAILQMALEVTNAQYGIFRLLDKTGQQLIAHAVAVEDLVRPQVEALPITSKSVMGWVARNRQPVCIADLREDPWRENYYPLDLGLEMRSELAIPLINASGRLEGVLNLESPQVSAFSEQDRRLLQVLATQAVIAIQEVRLLDAIQEVAQLLLTQPSQKVLERLVGFAVDLLNGDASAIWIKKGEALVLQAAWGEISPSQRVDLKDSLAGQVINGRASVAVSEALDWHYPDLLTAEAPISALAVPITFGSARQPAGVFAVFSASPEANHFLNSEWEKKVLTCLAYYSALAVQYASHQDALRTAQAQRAVAETFAVVGDIAANVLHHLNNKVGSIPVRIQGIRAKRETALDKDPYLSSNLTEIERSANEAMEAVRENLSHLRPILLADVSVANCVRAALEETHLPAGIEVKVSQVDNLPAVTAAQRSLSLVFTNLLINAADAMGGVGQIEITGIEDEGWVEIAIRDTGPGIVPELHERVFELSYSGRGQIRGAKLGFGLWWVKTLLVRLGGSVALESDGKHGTTFRVRLPVAGGQV